MSLILTGTKEHALLAMIVQESANAAQESGGFLGRTAMKKYSLLFVPLDVPMRYRFDLHHYGAICYT